MTSPILLPTGARVAVRAPSVPQIVAAPPTGSGVVVMPVPGSPGQVGPPGDGVQVFGEVPAGVLDGVNRVFTTSQGFRAATIAVYLNGLREMHFEETGSGEITLEDPPSSTDVLSVDYIIG